MHENMYKFLGLRNQACNKEIIRMRKKVVSSGYILQK